MEQDGTKEVPDLPPVAASCVVTIEADKHLNGHRWTMKLTKDNCPGLNALPTAGNPKDSAPVLLVTWQYVPVELKKTSVRTRARARALCVHVVNGGCPQPFFAWRFGERACATRVL